MNILYLIPARGGSKGVPKKNIKLLNQKPLLHYTIEFARNFTSDNHICLSTDDTEIIECARACNLSVDFRRPQQLATDSACTNGVINHAIKYYESKGRVYDLVVLLQPTSPFRKKEHLVEMLDVWEEKLDLLVSVKESHDNPYFNLFEENDDGMLASMTGSKVSRRQDLPKVYAFSGAFYVFNVDSLKEKTISNFSKVKKYLISSQIYSLDIDTEFDWFVAEAIIRGQ